MVLSRSKLATFLVCQRRFQLRFVNRMSWPTEPLDERVQASLARGRQFHRLLERHFMSLPVMAEAMADAPLRQWWTVFQNSGPTLPDGHLLPEIGLTVPVADHMLTGRFDLLIVGEDTGAPFAHVFDWKTTPAGREGDMRQDWQTRLYCAMLAEGGGAFLPDGRSPDPDDIAITYWHVTNPDEPRIVHYDRSWHAQNWAEIKHLIVQIQQMMGTEVWPLTDDWTSCRHCPYQAYCGRQEAGRILPERGDDEDLRSESYLQMEPETP
jgi:hypothetical protein